MKTKKQLILLTGFLIGYIIFSKYLLLIYNELITYIINPLFWMAAAFLIYLIWGRKNKKNYPLETDIIYLIIAITIIYNVLFFFSGIVVGYAKNPYYFSSTGVFINLFSTLAIIVATEYLRGFLINCSLKLNYPKYLIIIGIVYVLLDANLLSIYNGFGNYITMTDVLLKELIPSIALNILLIYLCKVAGFKAAAFYHSIIIIPTLIFSILPDFSWFLIITAQLSLILITYLLVQRLLEKKKHSIVITTNKKNIILSWVSTFSVVIILIMFGLGLFPVVPVAILTGSMEPAMKPGYLAFVEKCEISDIKENDIIQYKQKDYTVIHRVIKINNINGEKYLTLKGDNNLREDKEYVQKEQIVGKINFYIPYLGYPTYIINQMFGEKEKIEVEIGVD